jgi:hypothetical protein
MQKAKSHFIVLKNEQGNVEQHPMKEWLRRNPQDLPNGIDPSDRTSYELRHALKQQARHLRSKMTAFS